jgi:hypothetical protein
LYYWEARKARLKGNGRSADNDVGTQTKMPELSRFLGIVVRMHYREHPPAHIHAQYGDYEVLVTIPGKGNVIRVTGKFPPRARKLVLEWCRLHLSELRENWERSRRGELLLLIDPLE